MNNIVDLVEAIHFLQKIQLLRPRTHVVHTQRERGLLPLLLLLTIELPYEALPIVVLEITRQHMLRKLGWIGDVDNVTRITP